jgi:hypothetical protein
MCVYDVPSLKSLPPPTHTKTPFTPVREPRLAQIIAARGAEVEEFVCYDG